MPPSHPDSIPGPTRCFRRMEAEGRILTRDGGKYNSREDVVLSPKHMSATDLLAGFPVRE